MFFGLYVGFASRDDNGFQPRMIGYRSVDSMRQSISFFFSSNGTCTIGHKVMVPTATISYNFLALVFVQSYSSTGPSLLLAEAIDNNKKEKWSRTTIPDHSVSCILAVAYSDTQVSNSGTPTALPVFFILEFHSRH